MMKIFRSLEAYPKQDLPIVISIGNFDGVHLGHQAVLKEVKKRASALKGIAVIISFENHPATVLRPHATVPLLCSLEHKISLLEKAQMDQLILLTFTKEFSEQSAEAFIKNVRNSFSFQEIILGHDATLGKDRQGDRAQMEKLAEKEGFVLDYVDELTLADVSVSSSSIRALIQAGKFPQAEKLLGRPYSIYAEVKTGQGLGKTIGFPTLNIPVEGLCLPPLGVYAVKVKAQEKYLKGVANLGFAPTLRTDSKPILEVHIIEETKGLPERVALEVFFKSYLRPEKQFANLEALKKQIERDVEEAKLLLSTLPS